jgi:metal-sulfur cluster biosynthetic enzyme
MVTVDDVKNALRNVYDPEISINVQDLGLIYEVEVLGDHVKILHTLTSPMCPFADEICNDIRQAPMQLEGVNSVEVDITFDPPFTVDMIPEETRLEHGLF